MNRRVRLNTPATVAALVVSALTCTRPVQAQFNGSHTLGDFGVNSGTQPAPGVYAAAFYYRYSAEEVKDSKGTPVTFSPSSPGSLTLDALAPMVWYVKQERNPRRRPLRLASGRADRQLHHRSTVFRA
jgi:hypothetical protein